MVKGKAGGPQLTEKAEDLKDSRELNRDGIRELAILQTIKLEKPT